MLRAVSRERDVEKHKEIRSHNGCCVIPSLKNGHKTYWDFQAWVIFFFFFFWTTDAGLMHVPVPSSPPSPFQRISVTIPTSTAATVVPGSQNPPLLTAVISSEHAQ